MKKIIPLLLILFTTHTLASPFDEFLKGLKKDYFFKKTERGSELAYHVGVTKFGPLGRILSPDAIATYNGKLNLISLHEDLVEHSGRARRIKDARTIRGNDFRGTYQLSTIFHEMGHAELDVFIEREREASDQMLSSHYKQTLKSFYKKNFPKFNPHTLFHEHFGYYRSDLIELLTNEINDLLIANGFNRMNRSCYLNHALKQKLAEGISLEEFRSLMVIRDAPPYRTTLSTRYIYVRGTDIDLYSGTNAKEILLLTHNLFWGYHQEMYNFPINRTDLVKRMNVDYEFMKELRDCRMKLWKKEKNLI